MPGNKLGANTKLNSERDMPAVPTSWAYNIFLADTPTNIMSLSWFLAREASALKWVTQ